jgi:lysophospholipase L1-like esterase
MILARHLSIHAVVMSAVLAVACSSDDGGGGDGQPSGGDNQPSGAGGGSAGADMGTKAGGSAGSSGSATGAGGSSGSGAGNGGSGGSSRPDSGSGSTEKDSGSATDGPREAQAAYNPCPANGTPCAVMALGDSITAGTGGSDYGSYRKFLFQLALGHQQTITLVGAQLWGPNTVMGPDGGVVAFPRGNEGYSGYTIDTGGLMGIHPLVAREMQTYHPHIITLMIGTNDVDTNDDLANAPMRLGGLMDTIIATDPNVLLVLAQIVPTTDDVQNVRVKAYNDAMPSLVKARTDAGKHVILVDMYTAFTSHAGYKLDYMNNNKLHPDDAGYSKMADVWYAAIGPLFR